MLLLINFFLSTNIHGIEKVGGAVQFVLIVREDKITLARAKAGKQQGDTLKWRECAETQRRKVLIRLTIVTRCVLTISTQDINELGMWPSSETPLGEMCRE